jgi:hypothetical protein
VVPIVTMLRGGGVGREGGERLGGESTRFSMVSRMDQDSTTFFESLSPGLNLMRERGEDKYFPLGSEDIQNLWIFQFILPYIDTAYFIMKHRDILC